MLYIYIILQPLLFIPANNKSLPFVLFKTAFPPLTTFRPHLPYQAATPSNSDQVNESALENVLLAFAAKNSKIGYCQSMSFVAATMLMYMEEAPNPGLVEGWYCLMNWNPAITT